MPLPVVRSPLGLPLGDRGLLPLPDALPGVGAGVVAGGPYTVPKGCWIPIPGRPTGRGQGLFLRALPSGLQSTDPYSTAVGMEACSTPVLNHSGQLHIPPHTLAHVAGRGVVVGAPRACPRHWPSSPPRHRASARAGAPHMHPPGPFPPAHLDACHEDPALEPPRRRARAQLFTRPAADAGPWRRAARALPACERGKGRRRGWGGGAVGRGGGTEWLREVVHGGHRELHGGVWDGVGAEGPVGGAKARGGRMSGLLRGLVRGRARRGREEGEAWSAVLYGGSLTVPRAKAAGTRGRGVPGDGAWHWDVRAPDTVSTPPIGSARALSSGASHPAPSP